MSIPTAADIRLLFAMHTSPEIQAERLARSAGLDDTRSWVDPAGRRLSDRVWRQRRDLRRRIDETLRLAIAQGTDALVVAKDLEGLLLPALRPLRAGDGRIVAGQARRIVTTAPGRGGSGSFSARRLARTEITRAHGEALQFAARSNPFALGVRWALSGSHPRIDPCNVHAERDSGMGPGVYPVGDVPRYPEHPMCKCILSQVQTDDVNLVVDQLRTQYDL